MEGRTTLPVANMAAMASAAFPPRSKAFLPAFAVKSFCAIIMASAFEKDGEETAFGVLSETEQAHINNVINKRND